MPIEEKPPTTQMESTPTHPKASSSALEKSMSKMSVRPKETEGATASLSLPSILSEEPQPSTSVAASFRSISGAGAKRKTLKRKNLKKETAKKKQPKKTATKKRFQYTLSQLKSAIEAIQDGMSVQGACKKFNVPRTTIRYKLNLKSPIERESFGHCGPACVLGTDVEDMLVDWMIGCADMGFPVNKEGLISSVKKLLDEKKLENPKFTNNRPGRKWYESFRKRHPVLAQKEEVGGSSKRPVNEEVIKEWFQKVRNVLGVNVDVLNHPSRVFSMDEICFPLAPPTDPTSDKENITTFFVVNAEGNFVQPLTLFKQGRIPSTAPPNWHIGETEKGKMTGESFYEYVSYIFHQYLLDNNIPFPVVVFLDGQKSRITFHLSKFCWEHKIILIALHPNCSHILQPLEVAVFGTIKKVFKGLTKSSKPIKECDVPVSLFRIISDSRMKEKVTSGFAETGIFPFDEDRVDYSKCSMTVPSGQVSRFPIEISSEETDFIAGFSMPSENRPSTSNETIRAVRALEADGNFPEIAISSGEINSTQQPSTTVSNKPTDKFEIFTYLQFMESRIDPVVLFEFKRTLHNRQEWTGNPHHFSLFQQWRQITEEAMAPTYEGQYAQIQEVYSYY